jgi:dihydroorotase
VILPSFFDAHTHLRQGKLLEGICSFVKTYASHVVVMPNVNLSMTNHSFINSYRTFINKYIGSTVPLMTMKLTNETDAEAIRTIHKLADCRIVKLYPKDVTTNSRDGISKEFIITPNQKLLDCYETMSKLGMVLCLHGEMPDCFSLNRESQFIVALTDLLTYLPKNLKIVLEHITTAQAVDFVRIFSKVRGNIAATITPHHLVLDHDDVCGTTLKPDNFCLPIPKYPHDREALVKAAISGEECFFLGSDSAPHWKTEKRAATCCAGVYTSPFLPALLCHIFEQYDALDKLPNFVSGFGSKFYGILPVPNGVKMEKTKYKIEEEYHGVVPLWVGKELNWRQI